MDGISFKSKKSTNNGLSCKSKTSTKKSLTIPKG